MGVFTIFAILILLAATFGFLNIRFLKLPSTMGLIVSTFVIGTGFYYLAQALNLELNYVHALLFGALISPTDPIAVLGILKDAKAPKKPEIKIVGESLFNNGIGVVVFLTLFHIAEAGTDAVKAGDVAILFVQEVFGGILLGGFFGFIAYKMLRAIEHYETGIIISAALVTSSYVLSRYLLLSCPLAVVGAGLFIGNQARKTAFSEETERYLDKFWDLIDVTLNALLFGLIGLEVMILPFYPVYILLGIAAIPLSLLVRYSVLSLPVKAFKRKLELIPRTALLMTRGGLRGSISIALALSLAVGEAKEIILTTTYIVVIFSIAVQV